MAERSLSLAVLSHDGGTRLYAAGKRIAQESAASIGALARRRH
jgi:hypothetical protein